MRRPTQFDEVMIVNPSEGSSNSDQRVRLMRFHNIYPPELSGYAEPDPYGYYAQPQGYGYYAQQPQYYPQPQGYGYYAQPENYGYYGQPEPFGYYAEDPYQDLMYGEVDPAEYGYYGELDPAVGYYAQDDPAAYGYYAQAQPQDFEGYGYGPYGAYPEAEPAYAQYPAEEMGYYSQVPEMVGYGEPESQPMEDYPGVAYYGEPDYSGYVRQRPPAFNPGCPLPTNVSGYEGGDFAGYIRPTTVNATCAQFAEQPGSAPPAPDTFKPLW